MGGDKYNMREDLSLQLYNLRYELIAELVDNSENSATNIVVNETINEIGTLEFQIPYESSKIGLIKNGELVKFKEKFYKINDDNENIGDENYKRFTCESLESGLVHIGCPPIEIPSGSIGFLVDYVLRESGIEYWEFGKTDIVNMNRHLITTTEIGVYEALMQLGQTFGAMVTFEHNPKGKHKINFTREPINRGTRIEYGLNLKGLEGTKSLSNMFTRLTVFGAENEKTGERVNIINVNPAGKEYVENYDYYMALGNNLAYIRNHPELFLKETKIIDDSIFTEEDLYDFAREKIKEISRPSVEFSISGVDLSLLPEYMVNEPKVGEIVTVIDDKTGLEIRAIVQSYSKDYENPLDMNVTIGNILSYNDRFGEIIKIAYKADSVISDNGTINSSHITGQFSGDRLQEGSVGNIHIQNGVIDSAKIGNLAVGSAHIQKAAINQAHIGESVIGDAHIADVSASKLKTGRIDTSLVKIRSKAGEMEITGYQVLAKDTTNLAAPIVRAIFGKYKRPEIEEKLARGESVNEEEIYSYGLLIRGKDGKTVIMDENGIHNAGITDGAIDNNKISDDANIDGGKLDIGSVVHEINTQEGIELIEGSRIYMDNSTLDVVMDKITNIQTEQQEKITWSEAELKVMADQVRSVVRTIEKFEQGELSEIKIFSVEEKLEVFNSEDSIELIVRVIKDNEDITDTIDDSRFIWTRESDDKSGDKSFAMQELCGKILIINSESIYKKSNFVCTLYTEKSENIRIPEPMAISKFTVVDRSDSGTDNILNSELGNTYSEVYPQYASVIKQLKEVKTDIKQLNSEISLKASMNDLISQQNRKYSIRYIREYLNGNNVDNQNRITEFQAYANDGKTNILEGVIPTSNGDIILPEIMTDGKVEQGEHSIIIPPVDAIENECYIEFDLQEKRDDISFLHVWHDWNHNRSKKYTCKICVSEDRENWITIFDSNLKGNLYTETEKGRIFAVNQGDVLDSTISRLNEAEINITPEKISQTVTESMASQFGSSTNLLEKASKFVDTEWIGESNGNQFIFEENTGYAILNLSNTSKSSLFHAREVSLKLLKNSYYCMSFKIANPSTLYNVYCDLSIELNGNNINECKVFENENIQGIDIKNPKLYFLTFKTENENITLSDIKIKLKINNFVPSGNITILEPQFESGAFPKQWIYPYDLAMADFKSYREQTAREISDRVENGEFESYRRQTATEIQDKVSNNDFESYKNQTANKIEQVITENNSQVSDIRDEVNKNKQEADREFRELNNILGDLETNIEDAIKDGILDEAEKEGIRLLLKQFDKEYKDVIAQYDKVYMNVDLSASDGSNLKSSKDSFVSSYNSLVSFIESLISKTTITESDKRNLDTKRSDYNTKHANFLKEMQGALDTIANNKINKLENKLGTRFSKIEQTSDEIKQSVIDTERKLKTEISQKADRVDITGLVHFEDLQATGGTTINGSNIKTGTIQGIGIEGCHLRGTTTLYMTPNSTLSADGNSNHKYFYVMSGGSFSCDAGTAYFKNQQLSGSINFVDANTYINRYAGDMFLYNNSGYIYIRSKYGTKIAADSSGYFRPESNQAWALGSSSSRWSTAYVGEVNQSSDLKTKENIYYISNNKKARPYNTDLSIEDFYNFFRDDFRLATYDYKADGCNNREEEIESLKNKVGFIAQDITNPYIKRYLIKENKEPIDETNENTSLSYSMSSYIGIVAGGLQGAIDEIEKLKEENNRLKKINEEFELRLKEIEDKLN